jgi:hypothetical protein
MKPKPKPEYVQNRIFRGGLTGRYYFVKRAQRVGDDWLCVTDKIDVTESVQALLEDDRKKRRKKTARQL